MMHMQQIITTIHMHMMKLIQPIPISIHGTILFSVSEMEELTVDSISPSMLELSVGAEVVEQFRNLHALAIFTSTPSKITTGEVFAHLSTISTGVSIL